MEGRIHSSGAYHLQGHLSRMKDDLLRCYRDLEPSFEARVATRRRASSGGNEPLNVAVIGAGLAGLRCAEILTSAGAKVTIFEGRDRVGGRIYQCNLAGHTLDMGPNWVHGTEDNPIVKLAKETGTTLCAIDDRVQVYDPAGVPMSEEDVASGFEIMWSLVEDAFRYSNESCLDIPPNLSLKDFFHERLAKLPLVQEDKDQVMLLAEIWGSFIGDSWERQSLRWFWLEECLDGQNLFVADTHAPIIARLEKAALEHATVHFSSTVTAIESVTSQDHDPRVIVSAKGNKTFEFDEVVVTVPLGCLKRNKPTFSPPLPERITRGVRNASYCSLDKIYITFPSAFWEEQSVAAPQPETTQSGQTDAPSPTSPDAASSPSIVPSFIHFLRPTSYVSEPSSLCTLEMAPLSNPAVFGAAHAQPVLLIYTYSPCTEHVSALVRGLSPNSPEYHAALDAFLRPFYSRLPHYDAASPQCAPRAIRFSDWHGDDLAGNGCYTNFQVSPVVVATASGGTGLDGGGEGEVLLDEDVRAMRRGVPERGIWLAGEHTAPFVGLGTTTGAYWSGEAAGMRVLAANGLVKGAASGGKKEGQTGNGEAAAPRAP